MGQFSNWNSGSSTTTFSLSFKQYCPINNSLEQIGHLIDQDSTSKIRNLCSMLPGFSETILLVEATALVEFLHQAHAVTPQLLENSQLTSLLRVGITGVALSVSHWFSKTLKGRGQLYFLHKLMNFIVPLLHITFSTLYTIL